MNNDAVRVDQIRLPPTVTSIRHWGSTLVQFGMYRDQPYREVFKDPDFIKRLLARTTHVEPEMKDLQDYVKACLAVETQEHLRACFGVETQATR